MNISDGELMEGILEHSGYVIIGNPEEADVVLVNVRASTLRSAYWVRFRSSMA